MKKFLVTVTAILFAGFIYGQNASPDLISSSGDYFANSTVSLSWSIGECMTETFTNSNNQLSQGFQQNFETITIVENLPDNMQINIFPNPATDRINIEFSEIPANTTIQLFDIAGKQLINKKVDNTNEQLELSKFSSSTLILSIIKNEKIIKSVKIQKIN